MALLESNKDNQYLFIFIGNYDLDESKPIIFLLMEFNPLKDQYSDIYSFKPVEGVFTTGDFDNTSKISWIQTEKGFFIADITLKSNFLYTIVFDSSMENIFNNNIEFPKIIGNFHKRVFLKDEISLLCLFKYEYSNKNFA